MKNIIICTLALALSACFVNPVKMDRIKRELGSDPGNCLAYAQRAIPVLEREGYKTRLHFFDCSKGGPVKLHVMVTVDNSTLGVDSDHSEAITLHQMEQECPLANGKAPTWQPDYPLAGPPTGLKPDIGQY